MIFTPRLWQQPIGQFMVEHERCNVWSGMGTGKSSAAIAAFDTLRMFGEAKRALVIAPKRVALGTWPNEIVKFRESFGHLSIVAAIGTSQQRVEALRANADITCINYDNIEWLIATVGDDWPWDMVIADESTRLKGLRVALMTSKTGKKYIQGQGAVRAKALARIAHKRVRRWVNLTGSPAPNGIVDLWGQQFYIDGGQRLGSSFGAFQSRWFRQIETGQGRMDYVPTKYAQSEIEQLLKPCTITIDIKDYVDIKNPIESIVYADLPAKARQHYEEMEKQLFTELEDGDVEAFDGAGRSNKCLQIGNGFAFTEKGIWHPIHDEKIEALRSIVAETNGEPLLVRYEYVPDKERILKAFPKARTLDTPGAEQAFREGKLPMLVVHPASAGHGLNLQDNCRILVDFSTGWNLEYDEQVIERIGPTRQMQIGQDRAVYRYRIVARDTVEDTAVLPRIKSKATVQESLKNAMKMRQGA